MQVLRSCPFKCCGKFLTFELKPDYPDQELLLKLECPDLIALLCSYFFVFQRQQAHSSKRVYIDYGANEFSIMNKSEQMKAYNVFTSIVGLDSRV